MAISRSLRFQVLKRDGHTCRYCGAKAPDVKLHVDHVIPAALGGTDEPGNLVAACAECNGGKAAMPPDAETVADVDRDAIRWAAAMKKAGAIRMKADYDALQRRAKAEEVFEDLWEAWRGEYGVRSGNRPQGWLDSVMSFLDLGIRFSTIGEAIRKSMSASHVPADDKFRYMCGILWRIVGEMQDAAKEILREEDEVQKVG